ncbi:MAG: hypothetical protein HGA54_08065, partial [Actinobacteria bacterium]|nr:hypothetical protein [Actinomycetota bacterium]
MKKAFENLARKFQQFMIGRNGFDDLARFGMVIAFLLLIASLFVLRDTLYIAAIVILVYCYWRAFSKSLSKRYKENRAFCDFKRKLTRIYSGLKQRFAARKTYGKTHRFYTCTKCGQMIRVPKGQG